MLRVGIRDHPVFLRRYDGHMGIANTRAERDSIAATEVLVTMVGGRIVFEKKSELIK